MEVNRWTFWLLLWSLGVAPLSAAEPQWIWAPETAREAEPAGNCFARIAFEVQNPQAGRVEITADNKYSVWLNGERFGAGDNWQQMQAYDIKSKVKKGRNALAVMAVNEGGPAGLAARVVVQDLGGKVIDASSGEQWKTDLKGGVTAAGLHWWAPEFDDSKWKTAHVYGPVGKTAPWGNTSQLIAAVAAPAAFERKERPAGPFQLLDGDRVVFLGDTLIERAQTYDYGETQLTARYPDRHITFRNLGWSADTVFGDSRAGFGTVNDGYEQLKQRVFEQQPTVIVLGYGGAVSSGGKAGLPAFEAGLRRLLSTLDETQATIVFLGPIQQEDLGRPLPRAEAFNQNRVLYGQAIQKIAEERHAPFVDLYSLLGVGTDDKPMRPYTDNGVHLTAYGYWQSALALDRGLGWKAADWKISLKVGSQAADSASPGIQVTGLRSAAGNIEFTVLDPVLPTARSPVAAKDFQSGRTLLVDGLPAGTYQLRVDGQVVATGTAAQWKSGVSLNAGPEFDQVEELRNAILEKNQLFFHRWRPQNETYLFGFRKHEQGNNAKEIPMFDPLILSAEQAIAKLRQPLPHRYQLERQ